MEREGTRGLASVALAIVTMALIVVAAIVASRPFDVTLASGHAKSFAVSGTCEAAAKTAWNNDSRPEALWAVTVGTNMMGYTPVFGKHVKYVLLGEDEVAIDGHLPDAYCGGEARHRLIVVGVIVAFGVLLIGGVFLVHRRRIA